MPMIKVTETKGSEKVRINVDMIMWYSKIVPPDTYESEIQLLNNTWLKVCETVSEIDKLIDDAEKKKA